MLTPPREMASSTGSSRTDAIALYARVSSLQRIRVVAIPHHSHECMVRVPGSCS